MNFNNLLQIIRIEFPYKEKPTIETISKLLEDTITQQVYYLEWKYSEQGMYWL